jgi:hypothetical protein
LHLQDQHWSEGIARQAVWLSGKVPYREVAEILQEVGGEGIGSSTVWRMTQRWGQKIQEQIEKEKQAANATPRREEWIEGETVGTERMGVSMDGAMVYVLEEGWKELKAGTVFEVEAVSLLDPKTLEEEQVGQAQTVSYVAHLGGPDPFGKLLWSEAKRRGWTQAGDTQVVADGAAWIWNLVGEHFYDSQPIVDWYHAAQHLSRAAEYLYGSAENPAKQRWLNEYKEALFQGQVEWIVNGLRSQTEIQASKGLRQEAGYFENHKRRMNYLDMRTEGWLIGSGTVESGAKQYKARFAGPGMRWKRPCLERLIPIRSAVMSGSFSHVWRSAYYSPAN